MMTDEQRLHMITEQLLIVRDNLFRGMSKSIQKLQAKSINEVLELPNFTESPQRDSSATPRTWVGLTDEEIEKGRDKTFSINNPYCPCDSKTMRKAVRWAEAKLKAKNERLEKNT